MWARRCGLAPLWPSRIKVLVMSFVSSGFVFGVFSFLWEANIGYLDLSQPMRGLRCYQLPPECLATNLTDSNKLECFEDRYGQIFSHVIPLWMFTNHTDMAKPLLCSVGNISSCKMAWMPVSALRNGFHSEPGRWNTFRAAALVFLILAVLLVLSVLVHDLALLDEDRRTHIYSIRCIWAVWPEYVNLVFVLLLIPVMRRIRGWKFCIWIALLPVWTIWAIPVFMIVVYPIMFVWFLVQPLRMCRIMGFLSAVLCGLQGLFLGCRYLIPGILSQYLILSRTGEYSMVWTQTSCVCSCAYPVSQSTIKSLTVIGLGMVVQSSGLALRALKGLRRREWGNLLSVLYVVPVNVFPVIWTRPNGEPILFRTAGEPVQAEPAFDPFALMDEQPDSSKRYVQLEPTVSQEDGSSFWHRTSRSAALLERFREEEVEIGCCGFPKWPSRQSIESCRQTFEMSRRTVSSHSRRTTTAPTMYTNQVSDDLNLLETPVQRATAGTTEKGSSHGQQNDTQSKGSVEFSEVSSFSTTSLEPQPKKDKSHVTIPEPN